MQFNQETKSSVCLCAAAADEYPGVKPALVATAEVHDGSVQAEQSPARSGLVL